ncbi:MAG: hypothetical protein GX587_16795, partial [Bacteroidales bacterium]|nr:hypothetical protein [Bacteroidales bacterium]
MKTSLHFRACCGWFILVMMLFLSGSMYAQNNQPVQGDRENVNVPYPGITKSTSTAINVQNYTGNDENNPLHYNKLVSDLLISGCLKASNIQFRGNKQQIGRFDRNPENTNFPLESGIVLSTGNVLEAVGPNSSSSRSTAYSLSNESDLQMLVGSYSINDPSVLTFNFIPDGDVVEFRYIFASDEYPEWACSQFNDVFGFFISGPGISGPYSNGGSNIALLPDGSPVSINNIHVDGYNQNNQGAPCPDINGAYYVSVPAGSTTIEYDGRTTVLTARIEGLTPCSTYAMKIAIADASDRQYDSAVFLEAKSFVSTGANIKNFFNMIETYDVFQSCEPTELRFYRTDNTNITEPLEIEYIIEGTAVSGVHHTLTSGVAVIPANETSVGITYTLPLVALDGTKTIVVKINQSCLCDEQTQWIEKTIRIHDPFVLQSLDVADATSCIEGLGSITAQAAAGASNFDYVFTYNLYDGSDNLVSTLTPGGNVPAEFNNLPVGMYKLVITDNVSCHSITQNNIIISAPEAPVVTLAPFASVYENTPAFALTGGMPEGGVYSGIGVENGIFNPLVAGMGGHEITYTFTAENGCVGMASDTIIVLPPYYPCPTPEITWEVQPVSCPGGDDGMITVWVTGLEKPYDIQCLLFGCEPQCDDCTVPELKNGNPGVFMAGGLTAGFYTYRVVKDGCEYEVCIEVTEPEPLEASATPNDALCFGYEGSATIAISGGTMPYTLS